MNAIPKKLIISAITTTINTLNPINLNFNYLSTTKIFFRSILIFFSHTSTTHEYFASTTTSSSLLAHIFGGVDWNLTLPTLSNSQSSKCIYRHEINIKEFDICNTLFHVALSKFMSLLLVQKRLVILKVRTVRKYFNVHAIAFLHAKFIALCCFCLCFAEWMAVFYFSAMASFSRTKKAN